MRFSHTAHGLMFTLAVKLAMLISINDLNTYAEPAMQLCINGKCKMVSEHDGYHSQNTCIDDKCSTDMLGTNSTDKID
jgi:hypothetical protein